MGLRDGLTTSSECSTSTAGAGTVVTPSVDEKRGRPVDAAAHAAHEVLAHTRLMRGIFELALKPRGIEAERLGRAYQLRIGQMSLVLEEPVVHFPEPVLGAGGLG